MRLIDADALKKAIENYLEKRQDVIIWETDMLNMLDNAPTESQVTVFAENASKEEIEDFKQELENVLERPQGEWTDLSTDGRHTGWIACSVCGQEPPNESNLRTDFCPNCGARMKGDAE